MKKLYHFLVLLCLTAHAQSFAQCTTSVTLLPDRYVHDTTYASLLADTIYGSSGYTYIWNFSDGSSSTGPFVEIPLTESGAEIMYTLTVTDPSSCVSTVTYQDEIMHSRHVVLHCDSLVMPRWDTSYGATTPSPFQLLTVNDANSIVLFPLNMSPGYIGESFSPIIGTYTVNWGNGVSTQIAGPIDDFIYPGYVEHPGYIYGGEYKISGNVVYGIGTLTCPSIDLDPITLRVQGALAPPLITGSTTYCAGQMLHLTASDTTIQFHNMLHCTDTAGYSPVYYTYNWPIDLDPLMPYAGRSTYSFAWMDKDFNVLSLDTVLNLPGLTSADSGTYYFRIAENTVNYHEALYSVHVTVNTLPAVSEISGAPATLCQGATVTLNTTTPGGIWYSNLPVSVTDGVVTGLTPGLAAVIYRVSNSCGYSADTVMIDIIAAPNAGTVTGTHNVCIGSPVSLTDAVSGGVWTTVTGNASVSGGVVTGITTGADTVLYTVINGCGSAVATFPLSVNAVPMAEITGGASSICVGNTMTLIGTAAGGTWYSNLLVSVTSGGVVTGLAEGPGAVIYSISNSCGSSADTLFVTVAPPANAGVLTGTGSICVGASTTITPGATGGVWTTATGNASVAGGVISGVMAGADTVLYTVTNSCGTDVATLPVMVDAIPNADTITGAGSLCMSGTISLTAGAAGGTWSATNGSVTVSASGIVTPITPGTDTITYIVSNSCGADTATATITVGALPVAGSIFGIDTVCVGASAILTTSGVGGIWSSSDSAVIDITGAGLINAVAPGNATIIYAVTTACGTATAARSIHVLSAAECGVGVAGVSGLNQMAIYPNPTSGLFNIHLPASQAGAIITLTDISGRVVKVVNVLSNTTVVQVTLSDAPAGSYLVKVESDGVVYHDKIVRW